MRRCPRKTSQKMNGSLFASDVYKVDGCIRGWIICNENIGGILTCFFESTSHIFARRERIFWANA